MKIVMAPVVAAILLLAGAFLPVLAQTGARAEGPTKVIALRTESVELFDAPQGTVVRTLRKGEPSLGLPWTVVDSSQDGFFQVEWGGQRYWVRRLRVETTRSPDRALECKWNLDKNATVPVGSTRGLGQNCGARP